MKKTDRSLKAMLSFGAAALLAVGAATAQVASDKAFPGAESIDSSGSYQSELSACRSGHTQQDLATCLKEARNAQAEKQRGRLEDYALNAAARCDYHTLADDRAACRSRMLGNTGDIEGSVAAGGLLRESETVIGSTSSSTSSMGASPSSSPMGSSSSTMGGSSSPSMGSSGGSKY